MQLSVDYISVYICGAWSLLLVQQKFIPIFLPTFFGYILKIEARSIKINYIVHFSVISG